MGSDRAEIDVETVARKYFNYMKNMIKIAPMMDWTDRHCRYFMRLLSPSVGLYTEMITAAALVHGAAEKLLRFDPA